MTYLTISQQPDAANLVLYPNGDNSIGFSSTGGTNYGVIDDAWNNYDDTDYIYTNSSSEVTDWYTVENTTATGGINYVRIVARGASHLINQNISGINKIWIDDLSATDFENIANLTTGFKKYTATWYTKPSGGSWSWTDINNLMFGISVSSPTVTESYIFRPNGDANSTWATTGTYRYTEVDEEILNTSDYIWRNDVKVTQRFNLENHTVSQKDEIQYVKVFANITTGQRTVKLGIHTYGTEYLYATDFGTTTTYNQQWVNTSGWTTNPYTGNNWTWEEIDNLQIALNGGGTGGVGVGSVYVYSTYVLVATKRPELRYSQAYAVVNYSPSESTVTLPLPENITMSHSRTISRFTFPDGDYAVEDMWRSGKILHLSGWANDDIYTKMQDIANMTHYSSVVSVDGLPDTNLNTEYYIRNFSFNQKGGETELYTWSIDLEEA